ncbi:MAG TPA: NAD(P)H-quinone oxidoreductase [Steroidobacteraceae bacterium]|jgi:putative PIG3 family NAD(P)H quinone oxidoreductase|nr:NAD(P)H-quinone oxidoreductase [Steroidobacteraceae bacterium]
MSELPAQMTAIEIGTPGPPEALRPASRPVPQPGPQEVLIRVAAAGINRPDVLQRKGAYPPPAGVTDIPGLEVAGEVVRVGSGVTEPTVGARVCALVAGGGYAEYVAAPTAQCLPAPHTLSMEEAGVLPETFFTVYYNVFMRARLRSGETLLIHGGSSGIGTTAILLAKAFAARVIITAGNAEKCAACVRLGADVAIDYRQEDFVARTLEATGGQGADVVLDMVGGEYLARNMAAAAVNGRIAVIATQRGAKAEIDLRGLMSKRLWLGGSTLRPQSVADKGRIAAALRKEVWPLFESKALRPLIHARFPLREAARAHALMESGAHIGKIVLVA